MRGSRPRSWGVSGNVSVECTFGVGMWVKQVRQLAILFSSTARPLALVSLTMDYIDVRFPKIQHRGSSLQLPGPAGSISYAGRGITVSKSRYDNLGTVLDIPKIQKWARELKCGERKMESKTLSCVLVRCVIACTRTVSRGCLFAYRWKLCGQRAVCNIVGRN